MSFHGKVNEFLKQLENWKSESDFLSLAELIWKIYLDTGFFNYVGLMPNGVLRQTNLRMLFERAKEYEKTSFSGLFNFIRFIEKLKNMNGDMSSAKIIGESENVVRIMSIHKSKGLEFPVVFLSSTNKQMNMQDLKKDILIHNEIGFGPDYINHKRMIEYPTAAKQAIKIINKNESISEEMRILYVALTRAKEKLIITGTMNDIDKTKEKMLDLLSIYNSNNKLNPILVKNYITYLDWIYLVYLTGKLDNELNLYVHVKNDFKIESETNESIKEFNFTNDIDLSKFDKLFSWKYENEKLVSTPIKTSVSEIKSLNNKNDENIGLNLIETSFMNQKSEISSAQKGTVTHFVLQKLDFSKTYTQEELKKFINELLLKKLITTEEANCVNLPSIQKFMESELYSKIQNAKIVEKEKVFCISKKVEEYDMQEVLIQGIIDLYFIDENSKITLVDYKTDFVNNENELIEKYKVQLQIYKEALENGLNLTVNHIYIYSTYLGKTIELNFMGI